MVMMIVVGERRGRERQRVYEGAGGERERGQLVAMGIRVRATVVDGK